MKRVVVIGAGHIGATVARMLGQTGDYDVVLADQSAEALASNPDSLGVSKVSLDVTMGGALEGALTGARAALATL